MNNSSYKERKEKLGLIAPLDNRIQSELIESFKISSSYNHYNKDYDRIKNLNCSPKQIYTFLYQL